MHDILLPMPQSVLVGAPQLQPDDVMIGAQHWWAPQHWRKLETNAMTYLGTVLQNGLNPCGKMTLVQWHNSSKNV